MIHLGCDVHSRLEIFMTDERNEEAGPRWTCIMAGLFDNPYFSADRPVGLWNTKTKTEPLTLRNYRLFAMLADVRNGTGFAGVDTGDRVEPIAMPKGVPADASPEWREEVESWGPDLHSTSYFTLEELDAYDWDGVVFERGVIPEQEYLRLRGTETAPTSWSGGIWGAKIITLTAAEYEAMSPSGLAELRGGVVGEEQRIYVQHQWAETRRENMGELASVMEIMRHVAPTWDEELQKHVDPRTDRVRIVFGFDN